MADGSLSSLQALQLPVRTRVQHRTSSSPGSRDPLSLALRLQPQGVGAGSFPGGSESCMSSAVRYFDSEPAVPRSEVSCSRCSNVVDLKWIEDRWLCRWCRKPLRLAVDQALADAPVDARQLIFTNLHQGVVARSSGVPVSMVWEKPSGD